MGSVEEKSGGGIVPPPDRARVLLPIFCTPQTRLGVIYFTTMNTIKNVLTYMNARPILIGLVTVVLTVAFGMSLAFATGMTTPSQVMAQVLRVNGVSREASAVAVGLMRKIGLGAVPSAADGKAMDGALKRDAASDAMAGQSRRPAMAPNRADAFRQAQPPKAKRTVPNAAQVELLRKDPKLAPIFDERFGKGEAEKYLKGDQSWTTRRLPDGSSELLYEDGWIETIHPDGSVDGRMGP